MKKSFAITTENIDKIISDLKKKIKVANKGKEEGMYIRFAIPKKYRKNPLRKIIRKKKMTYGNIIIKYLEARGDWVIGNGLANLQTEFGWLPERACRTARSLAERGLIERQEFEKNGRMVVFYRHKPKPVYTFTPDPNDQSKIIMNKK